MIFFIYSVWILNLFIGLLIFNTCYRTSSTYFFLLNTFCTIMIFFIHYRLIFIDFLWPLLTCIPILISVLKILKDFTQESRDYEKNLVKIILFLDLTVTKARFGRGIREAIITSHHIITIRSHVDLLCKKNVVLQQPKSRFFRVFSELEEDLNAVLNQKVGQKDLIEHIKKKYQKRLSLLQKTKIALSQYYSQSFVISFFWLCAICFLVSQGLFFDYSKTILLSFALLLFGSYVSKKLLIINDFRI